MNETKLKMTVDEALQFADEWTKGATFHADSQGWRAVCAVLAEEVRRIRAPREVDEEKEKSNFIYWYCNGNHNASTSVLNTALENILFEAWLARAKNDAAK